MFAPRAVSGEDDKHLLAVVAVDGRRGARRERLLPDLHVPRAVAHRAVERDVAEPAAAKVVRAAERPDVGVAWERCVREAPRGARQEARGEAGAVM